MYVSGQVTTSKYEFGSDNADLSLAPQDQALSLCTPFCELIFYLVSLLRTKPNQANYILCKQTKKENSFSGLPQKQKQT